jgi:hypothetical protein
MNDSFFPAIAAESGLIEIRSPAAADALYKVSREAPRRFQRLNLRWHMVRCSARYRRLRERTA